MTEPVSPRRSQLGARLRRLRFSAGYRSGSALARALDWPQSKVSKIEVGRQLPTDDDITQWLDACGSSAADVSTLRRLLIDARLEHRSFDELWRAGGLAADQDEIAEAEARAAVVAEYQPSFVPGLAQTAAYTRAVLSAPASAVLLGATREGIDAVVAARLRRQQLLYMPGKRIRLLIGEAALRVRFGPPAEAGSILAGQLDRLLALFGLPGIELGVLPFDEPSPLLPAAGVALLDEKTAWVETLVNERMVDDPKLTAVYVEAFDVAMAAAARGDDAAGLIRRAAQTLG